MIFGGVEEEREVECEPADAVGLPDGRHAEPWGACWGRVVTEPACFDACARHDEEIGFWGYAFVKEAEVLAEQLARVVSGRVDDDGAMVRSVLTDILKRRNDVALPSVEGASDEFLEICGILVCHRGKYKPADGFLFYNLSREENFYALRYYI